MNERRQYRDLGPIIPIDTMPNLRKSLLSRRFVFLLVFLSLVVLLGVSLQYAPNWSWIVDHEKVLRKSVASAPVNSWCIGLLVYFALSFVPGTAGKSVVFGWLFGFWGALAIVELGLTSVAMVSFLCGRYFFSEMIYRKWPHRLRKFSQRFDHDGPFYLLLLRLGHAPFTIVNYVAGALRIPLFAFSWTTLLGILPGAAVFTFAGTRVPSLRTVAERGASSLIDLPLFVTLLATAILPILLRYMSRSFARQLHRAHRLKSDMHRTKAAPASESKVNTCGR